MIREQKSAILIIARMYKKELFFKLFYTVSSCFTIMIMINMMEFAIGYLTSARKNA